MRALPRSAQRAGHTLSDDARSSDREDRRIACDEPVVTLRNEARDYVDHQPGVLERVFTVPFGTVPGMVALHLRITEVLVHGWDLARAIGELATFPDDLAEQELTFGRGRLADVPPDRSPFAPPQPLAEAGRDCAWYQRTHLHWSLAEAGAGVVL